MQHLRRGEKNFKPCCSTFFPLRGFADASVSAGFDVLLTVYSFWEVISG